ncbi:MAG: hypothetical protein Q7K45_04910 [Nanoarchaeota archaeon]|nr:hypothetical protein [Nanoarchaeota archaeon]
MKIKRMVKRLFAVSTGAVMLGATAMGAMAADLNNYPGNFVTDGTFNGFFVVGEAASTTDNIAMTDIAVSMKVAGASSTATTTVEGDAWLVGTSAKKLEMVNSNASDSTLNGETFRDIATFIGDDELEALNDGKWITNENEFGYQQFIFFDAAPSGDTGALAGNRLVKYAENDADKTADHLYFANSRQIARYTLEFTSNAQSDVTDSAGTADTSGTYLDDFEDTTLSILGKTYTVVQARRPNAAPTSDSIKLLLMAGATSDTLLEGESKTYQIGDKTYDATLTFVDSDEAKFTVNGEQTNKLKDGDTYVLADKSEVGVSEILYQDYAGGVHSATFFLGARKLELKDTDTMDTSSSNALRVGSEDIEGANVIIEATDDNTTFSVSRIRLNITTQDEYFVGAGEKLSDVLVAAGDEKEMLFDGGFDVEYKGLSEEATHDIKLKTSSNRRYKLQVYDGDGNSVNIPVAYAVGNGNVTLGEETYSGTRNNQKRLRLVEGEQISKDDFFIVTGGTASDGSAKSYLLQYMGADRQTKTSPKIKFKNQGATETLEYSVTSQTGTGTVATLKLGGYSFTVENRTTQGLDDFDVAVDFAGDGTVTNAAAGAATVAFIDSYGSHWAFAWNITYSGNAGDGAADTNAGSPGNSSNPNWISLTQTTPNLDDYDNFVPTTVILNITSTSDPEVRVAQSGLTLKTPEGETEVSYGYTAMGSYATLNAPSGDPQEFTLSYPEKQRLPQVYFTSGATSSSTTTGGDMVAVTVVDATKLDSEVASVSAQNLIVVGGPCVNTVAAELLGNPSVCTEGFSPGKARIKLFENANGKIAMLVAGHSGADTRLAGKVLAHRASELSGTEVVVEGTTYTDATISAPSAAGSTE